MLEHSDSVDDLLCIKQILNVSVVSNKVLDPIYNTVKLEVS